MMKKKKERKKERKKKRKESETISKAIVLLSLQQHVTSSPPAWLKGQEQTTALTKADSSRSSHARINKTLDSMYRIGHCYLLFDCPAFFFFFFFLKKKKRTNLVRDDRRSIYPSLHSFPLSLLPHNSYSRGFRGIFCFWYFESMIGNSVWMILVSMRSIVFGSFLFLFFPNDSLIHT
ncbi:hypothetical protein ASPWEDRAFT_312908 [Aspergillus wentii DTO 134E9]|uniref:Uncharacterized protein n=1 Tax=Aspergillus wentii DTO 134E9 TaxID=1073089 RepID=A0A1L9RT98_ASPWE|nr:uncharacterized protein ASPWEDRAFT_312908 [Aspergillus wentii DTO 134E9]OJJ38186.1 hypothetical protein ASPWEDRAFT_312908 [Aspergillus wentii DTO 134E9]